MQAGELDTQLVPRLGVVDLEEVGSRRELGGGNLGNAVGELLAQDLAHVNVLEGAGGDEVAARLGPLVGGEVRLADVPHVGEAGERGGAGLLGATVHESVDVDCAGVEVLDVGVVLDGAVDHGWADGRYGEVGLLLLDKVPAGLLGEHLGRAVGDGARASHGLLVRHGVPVGLGVGVAGAVPLAWVYDGGEGGGDDDALHLGGIGGNGLKDARGALDGGVEKVLLVVLDLKGEGGGGVDHTIDALDGLIEGTGGGDVRDDDGGEGLTGVGKDIVDLLGRALATGLAADVVAIGEEGLNDMGTDKGRSTGDKDETLAVGAACHQSLGLVDCFLDD